MAHVTPSDIAGNTAGNTVGKPVVSITPTFLLRKVDPAKVMENYRAGKYTQYTLPEQKIAVPTITATVQPTLGTSPDDDIFTFRLRNNTLQTVATSNHQQYILYHVNGYEMPMGGECDWCEEEFKTQSIGIPVRAAEITAGDRRFTAYYMENCYCSYECTFAAFKLFCGVSPRMRDPVYMNSEHLIRHLYNVNHPEAGPLQSAPDFRLYKRKKRGVIDRTEFSSRKHTYTRMPNVILAPLKVQYYKQNY